MKNRIVTIVLLAGVATLAPLLAYAQAAATVPKDPVALGYLNLRQRHPDGFNGPQDFDSHSSAEALRRLEQMRGFLVSFERLTERARTLLSEAELRAIDNTDGGMQTIGFHNIPLLVEGTLLKQEYQLVQAKYELAQLKYERQQITAKELALATEDYRAATRRFQVFWDTKSPTD